jgi:hypothetical protein
MTSQAQILTASLSRAIPADCEAALPKKSISLTRATKYPYFTKPHPWPVGPGSEILFLEFSQFPPQ